MLRGGRAPPSRWLAVCSPCRARSTRDCSARRSRSLAAPWRSSRTSIFRLPHCCGRGSPRTNGLSSSSIPGRSPTSPDAERSISAVSTTSSSAGASTTRIRRRASSTTSTRSTPARSSSRARVPTESKDPNRRRCSRIRDSATTSASRALAARHIRTTSSSCTCARISRLQQVPPTTVRLSRLRSRLQRRRTRARSSRALRAQCASRRPPSP